MKLPPKDPGRFPFQGLYKLVYAVLRINFNQKIYMVWHDFKLN